MHILMITRHYPPEISGGARRPKLYADALRKLGHRVTIVTPFELKDKDSLTVRNTAIENGLKALHDKDLIPHPNNLFTRLKNHLRVWAYWPDDNIGWVKDVIKTLKHEHTKPDWIMTTSPPESIHIAGAKLSKHMNIPWIAEMRDTWVEVPHRKILEQSKIRATIEKAIAKRTLSSASAITAVSEIVMTEARKYSKSNTPECIISHFSNSPPAPYVFDSSKINLVHTGGFTLSDRRRKLLPLIRLLDNATTERDNLVFHIAGPLSEEEILLIEKAQTTVKWHRSVSLSEARALQAGADGLILYTPNNSHALPGKYAEYALTGKPILYLGDGEWLDLVDDPSRLRPLETAVMTLTKGEAIVANKALTDIQAAQSLVTFLESIDISSSNIVMKEV